MLRKIMLACVAGAIIATVAAPTDASARRKVVYVKERTFFRGQGWIFTGRDWTGVGMYPYGAWSDEGCWRHDRDRPRWHGVWVCKPY